LNVSISSRSAAQTRGVRRLLNEGRREERELHERDGVDGRGRPRGLARGSGFARRPPPLHLGGHHPQELTRESHDVALGVTARPELPVDRLRENRERSRIARALRFIEWK